VGASGAPTGLRPPGLEHDHRLGRRDPRRGFHEPRTVPHRFEETGDEARVLVAGEILEQVGDLEIDLVADGDESTDADALLAELADDQSTVGAALRDHAHVAGHVGQAPEIGSVEVRGARVHADAVGPHEPHAAGTGRVDECGLLGSSRGIHLAESRGQDHRGPGSARGESLHGIQHCPRGQADQRQIDSHGQVRHSRHGR
jgi:hypothetical protein